MKRTSTTLDECEAIIKSLAAIYDFDVTRFERNEGKRGPLVAKIFHVELGRTAFVSTNHGEASVHSPEDMREVLLARVKSAAIDCGVKIETAG